MAAIADRPTHYGLVTKILHWGMAILFLAQFLSAAAHWGLPREDAIRQTLWSYHYFLGKTLFILVFLRGIWGLANIPKRPPHTGFAGKAAVAGHVAIYLLMVIVPFEKILALAGGTHGLDYLGLTIVAPQPEKIAWTQIPQEYHGEMGWILGLLILGHMSMALVWHRLIQRDHVLERMTG